MICPLESVSDQRMNDGIAVNGPLNGTKLSAPSTWSGRVESDLSGVYSWDPISETYVWRTLEKPLVSRTGRPPRKYKKKLNELAEENNL